MGTTFVSQYVVLFTLFIKVIVCEVNLEDFLQPYDVASGRHDDLRNAPYHVCTRECKPNDCRTCYYRFVCEAYMTMNGACRSCPNITSDCYGEQCITADGFQRSVLCYNRRMPGPSIQVCQGDLVIVDVTNMLPGYSTTIHWHGLLHMLSPHMDGVPMVTQCAIPEGTTFRYQFYAESHGTHFYHSHVGLQKVDGLVGSLVIRCPAKYDPNSYLYHEDLPSHVMVIQDWQHTTAVDIFPGKQNPLKHQQPLTFLIQGTGIYMNGSMVLAEFNVKKGKSYRFRIIAATCFSCQFVITFEKHDLIVIEADGMPTKPYKVKSLTIAPGERFSVVVVCDRPVGSYWIQVRAIGFCVRTKAHQEAILRYNDYHGPPNTPRPGHENVNGVNDIVPTLNPSNSDCSKRSEIERGPCIADLRGFVECPAYWFGEPDLRILWAFGFYPFDDSNIPYTNTSKEKYLRHIGPTKNDVVMGQMNGCGYRAAPSPLLSQWADVPRHLYCPNTAQNPWDDVGRWGSEPRECINVVNLPLGKYVEIVICDAQPIPGMTHPIHLHGYNYYIVEQGPMPQPRANATFREKLEALYQYLYSSKRKPIPEYCPNKDTVTLSSDGYVIAWIYTNNPGYWYFHCHFAYHLEAGMAGVLKVGEHRDMPPPPRGFPRCGNFLLYPYDRCGL